jgi:hypothetical protein
VEAGRAVRVEAGKVEVAESEAAVVVGAVVV